MQNYDVQLVSEPSDVMENNNEMNKLKLKEDETGVMQCLDLKISLLADDSTCFIDGSDTSFQALFDTIEFFQRVLVVG